MPPPKGPIERDAIEAAAGAAAANRHEHERQAEWMPALGADREHAPPVQELAAVEQSVLRRAIPQLRSRWPDYEQACERLAGLDARAAEVAANVEHLREQLRTVDDEDADRFRAWIEGGREGDRPTVRRPVLERTLHSLEVEAAGIAAAVESAEQARVRVITAHRRVLVRDATELIEQRRRRAEAAIAEAERARAALAEAAQLRLWSRVYPDASSAKVPPYATLGAGQTVANATLGVTSAMAAAKIYAALRDDLASIVDVMAPEHRSLLTAHGQVQAVEDPTAAAWVGDQAGKSAHRREVEAWMEAYRREYGALPAEHQLEAFIAQHQQARTLPTL